ncbi:MAG: chorismate synthase [Candidatus Omnitrophica bacterium]|nr:chorismate synthase [Candidatus Omnitrophota bacterium]
MSGNTFGNIFKVTTFGESHGRAIGAVVDGVCSGLALSSEDIQKELNRRRPGQSKVTTQRQELDQAQILSGVFEGKTTGAPIGLLIYNQDANPKDYAALKNIFRPGHADFVYEKKYGVRDWRGGGRASGRETAMRVAAGAIAKKILAEKKIKVIGYVKEIGGIVAKKMDLSAIEKNIVRAPDAIAAKQMIKKIEEARQAGDSLGGIVEVIVKGCPIGLGEPVFDKLGARLAAGVMSIGSIKGVEIGAGFESSSMLGSEFNDVPCIKGGRVQLKTNNGGGISAGISNGEDIVLRVAVRPTCSIAKPQQALGNDMKIKVLGIKGRHDPCICPRAVVVVEAMVALVLVDALFAQKATSR